MPTLEWIELACVHVLTTGKEGRCYVLISPFWQKMHAWLHFEKKTNRTRPFHFSTSTCSLLEVEEDGVKIMLELEILSQWQRFSMYSGNYTFVCGWFVCFPGVNLHKSAIQLFFPPSFLIWETALLFLVSRWAAGWDSWAYFHLPNTKTAVGPPCSSLIIHIQARASWQVCWSHSMFCDLDNTFSLCGQKCWGHHTSWDQSCETQLGQKLWIIPPLWELCPSVDPPDPR